MSKKIEMIEFDVGFDDLYYENDNSSRNVSIVANEIRRRIEKGATVDQISWYKAKTLKDVLSFFRIDGRSKLTYKEDMAERLVDVLSSITDDTGVRSKKYNTVEDEPYNEEYFIYQQNQVISEIKRKGGL